MAESTEGKIASERARIAAIADKYRAGTSPELKRTIIRDFVVWMAKEGFIFADDEQLYNARAVIEIHLENYLEEEA